MPAPRTASVTRAQVLVSDERAQTQWEKLRFSRELSRAAASINNARITRNRRHRLRSADIAKKLTTMEQRGLASTRRARQLEERYVKTSASILPLVDIAEVTMAIDKIINTPQMTQTARRLAIREYRGEAKLADTAGGVLLAAIIDHLSVTYERALARIQQVAQDYMTPGGALSQEIRGRQGTDVIEGLVSLELETARITACLESLAALRPASRPWRQLMEASEAATMDASPPWASAELVG